MDCIPWTYLWYEWKHEQRNCGCKIIVKRGFWSSGLWHWLLSQVALNKPPAHTKQHCQYSAENATVRAVGVGATFCSRSAHFKSRPGHRQSWVVCGSPQPFPENTVNKPRSHLFQLINYHTIQRYTFWHWQQPKIKSSWSIMISSLQSNPKSQPFPQPSSLLHLDMAGWKMAPQYAHEYVANKHWVAQLLEHYHSLIRTSCIS
jgi:hypothetical protein